VARASSGTTIKILCQHTCRVCGAKFYEEPVVDVNKKPGMAEAATPRTELEKTEDQLLKLGAMQGAAKVNG
jgi:hypothetical protein